MSLHGDLLDQADFLARCDPRRPKQVNLRRAISSAYYAIFHLLASESANLFAVEAGYASRIGRSLNHAEMKAASVMIVKGELPKLVRPQGQYQPPSDLVRVAKAFCDLQEARHLADYDLDRSYLRSQAIEAVGMARQAFEAWERVRRTDVARIYQACFLLMERWSKTPR